MDEQTLRQRHAALDDDDARQTREFLARADAGYEANWQARDNVKQEPQDAQIPEEDLPTCRICLDTTTDDPELGRLFSPCLCRGSQRYVHTGCLNAWRQQSTEQKSYFQCNLCQYRYNIGRAQYAALIAHPYSQLAGTILFFILLVFLSGFLASGLLYVTKLLPSAPIAEELMWFVMGSNPFSSPLDYGDVLGGVVENGFRAFAGGTPDELQVARQGTVLEKLLFKSGFTDPSRQDAWSVRMITHFSLGFSVLGIISFFQMVISVGFLAPLHHMRIFRRTNREARAGERRGGGFDLALLMSVVFVLVGTVKAFRTTYRLVGKLSRYVLMRAQDQILEVR